MLEDLGCSIYGMYIYTSLSVNSIVVQSNKYANEAIIVELKIQAKKSSKL